MQNQPRTLIRVGAVNWLLGSSIQADSTLAPCLCATASWQFTAHFNTCLADLPGLGSAGAPIAQNFPSAVAASANVECTWLFQASSCQSDT